MPAESRDFELRDGDGRRLRVVWSRSGKSVGLGIILDSPPRFAQVGVHADRVEALAAFLGECPPSGRSGGTAPDTKLELDDRDHIGARLQAAWNRQGNRMTLSMIPATPWNGDAPEVTLSRDQVTTLATFLRTGPPSA